jgi:hypothetical protein
MCEAKRGQGGGTCKLKKEDLACDGTVSELEACLDEQIAAIEAVGPMIPGCTGLRAEDVRSAFTDSGALRVSLEPPPGPACTAFNKRCPNVFGGSSSSSTVSSSSGPTVVTADAGPAPVDTCGNGLLDPGEECDLSAPGLTCASVTMGALPRGYVLCNNCRLDTSACTSS